MAATICPDYVTHLRQEAELAARRLQRGLALPPHEVPDLRQDFLLDLLRRLPSFDRKRGSLGAFANTVIAHRASRIARRVKRERSLFGAAPVSLDQPLGDDGGTLAELVPDEDRGGGQTTDAYAWVDQRIDLRRGLQALPTSGLALCAGLLEHSPAELASKRSCSRAGIYRAIGEVRMRLLMAGVSSPYETLGRTGE